MNEIFKIMNSDYHFLKQHKTSIKELNRFLKKINYKMKIVDEITYLKVQMLKYSIELKYKLDTVYLYENEELNRLDYQLNFDQRNHILKKIILKQLENNIILNNEIIFPTFSKKLNDLYLNQPAKLMLPINYKLIEQFYNEITFKDFDSIINSTFLDSIVIDEYTYFNQFKVIKVNNQTLYYDGEDFKDVVLALQNEDKNLLITLLLKSSLTNKKRKKLEKLRGKKYAIK